MRIRYECGGARISGAKIDLNLTLMESAQCFTWTHANGAYYGFAAGVPVRARREEDGISLFPCDPSTIDHYIRYFDLTRDYARLAESCAGIPRAARAFELLSGLRVLNQDAWTAIFSFILSANNNTGRIRKLVTQLSEAFGEAAEIDGVRFFAVPTPEALNAAGEEKLRAIGTGYRAPYLIGTARRMIDGFPIGALGDMPYEEAHRLLVALPGVGDKVADCAQLFGCGHAEAFPVDVWVERLLRAWFPHICPGDMPRAKLSAAARAHLGAEAGLIQQYLFHCARLGLIDIDEPTRVG